MAIGLWSYPHPDAPDSSGWAAITCHPGPRRHPGEEPMDRFAGFFYARGAYKPADPNGETGTATSRVMRPADRAGGRQRETVFRKEYS